jgi:hypothetical protein
LTRAAALDELEKPTYAPAMQEEDREYVIKKLGLNDEEFNRIMSAPKKTFWEYPSYTRLLEGPLFKGLYILARDLYRARQKRQHGSS